MKFHTAALQFLVASAALRFGVRAQSVVVDHTSENNGDSVGRLSPNGINNLRSVVDPIIRGDGSSSKTGTMHHTVASDVLLETLPVDSGGRFSSNGMDTLASDDVQQSKQDLSAVSDGSIIFDTMNDDDGISSFTSTDGDAVSTQRKLSKSSKKVKHSDALCTLSLFADSVFMYGNQCFDDIMVTIPPCDDKDDTCYISERLSSLPQEEDQEEEQCFVGGSFPAKKNLRYNPSTGDCEFLYVDLMDDSCNLYTGDDGTGSLGLKARINVKDNLDVMFIQFTKDMGLSFYNIDDERVAVRSTTPKNRYLRQEGETKPLLSMGPHPHRRHRRRMTDCENAKPLQALQFLKVGVNVLQHNAGDERGESGVDPEYDVFNFEGAMTNLIGSKCQGEVKYSKYPDIIQVVKKHDCVTQNSTIFGIPLVGSRLASSTLTSTFESTLLEQSKAYHGSYFQDYFGQITKNTENNDDNDVEPYAEQGSLSLLFPFRETAVPTELVDTTIQIKKVPVPGTIVEAANTLENTALFSQSSASHDYKSRARVGETRTFIISVKAFFYEAVLQHDKIDESYLSSSFVNDVLELEKLKAGNFREEALVFFNNYGTHFKARVKMGAHRYRSAYFSSQAHDLTITAISRAMESNDNFADVLGLGGSDRTPETATYASKYEREYNIHALEGNTKVWLTSLRKFGGDGLARPTIKDFCLAAYCDELSVPVDYLLSPIYELFDKINGVDGDLLWQKTRDYLSEALYPTKGPPDEPKYCQCYKKGPDDTERIRCGAFGYRRGTYSECERSCNKLDVPACHGGNVGNKGDNTIDTVYGALETCKWDDNAACTWDNASQSTDCVNNCVCLIDDTDICRYPLMYGQPYYLQLVTGKPSVKRWLTGSRRSKRPVSNNPATLLGDLFTSDNHHKARPRTGSGDYVWTEDGADNGGDAGYYDVYPNQYQWLLGSEASDGTTLDDNGQVSYQDRNRDKCIEYGKPIYIQGLYQDNHWLTGGRGRGNQGVYMAKTGAESSWMVRSVKTPLRTTRDPRYGECVRSKDQVYFQATNLDDRYLLGGWGTGDWDVRTRANGEATRFEIRSNIDVEGQTTTEPASPLTLSDELLSLSSSSEYTTVQGWSRILASDPILESSTDSDSTISIIFEWKDQGYNNRKGRVRVLLRSDDETIVAQKVYQRAPHNWEKREELLTFDHELVNLARVGYSYEMWVSAGWGGGHSLYLRDFELETNFAFV